MKPPSIDDLKATNGDYQKTYHWVVRFTKVPNVIRTLISSEKFNARCTSVTLPKLTNSKIDVNVRGVQIRIPGISKYSDNITVKLLETTDAYVRRAIEAWREACWSYKTGKSKNYADIIGTMRIDMLEGDHSIVPTSSTYVNDVWMTDYTLPELGNGNEVWSPTLTLTYNYSNPVNSN